MPHVVHDLDWEEKDEQTTGDEMGTFYFMRR
jgi:hypothetical protein